MKLDDDDLSALVQRHATRHRAPDELRAGIRTQVALADAGRAAPASPPRRAWLAGAGIGGASFALGSLATWMAAPLLQRLQADRLSPADLVALHVRALRVGPLTEVTSTDRHTVKPWYQGRLDYAPPVFDLAADGFPLTGGRVEPLHDQAVAALVYARDRHLIDVLVWPADAAAPRAPQAHVHRGFNLLHWSDGTMQVWAVSDLERGELARFGQLWRARAAAP